MAAYIAIPRCDFNAASFTVWTKGIPSPHGLIPVVVRQVISVNFLTIAPEMHTVSCAQNR